MSAGEEAFWTAIREGRSYEAADVIRLRVENQELREAVARDKDDE
jgi:hypothetical protein